MTIEQRNQLLAFAAKATSIDGAELCMDGEGLTVERDDYVIAYFPYDGEPMSAEDETYNKQVRYNAGLFMTCRDNLSELIAQVEVLEAVLRQIKDAGHFGGHAMDCQTVARDESGKRIACECGLTQNKIALEAALNWTYAPASVPQHVCDCCRKNPCLCEPDTSPQIVSSMDYAGI